MKSHELLLDFFDQRFTSAFEEALHNDEFYMKADMNTSKALEDLFDLELNEKQKYAADELVAAHNECANSYGKVAYQCGFNDAVRMIFLLFQIGIEI